MSKMQNLERVEVQSVAELRQWFEENHTQRESIWLVTYKKNVPDKYLSVQDVLDEAVCFGWIDGRRLKLDDERTMQLLSPRKAQHWVKSYKDRVARLIEEGRMHECGQKVVAAAKESELWDFMNDVDALIKPDDLIEALEQYPSALKNYEAFPDSAKRDILRWIKMAKKPETRAKRIKETAELASQNRRASGTS